MDMKKFMAEEANEPEHKQSLGKMKKIKGGGKKAGASTTASPSNVGKSFGGAKQAASFKSVSAGKGGGK